MVAARTPALAMLLLALLGAARAPASGIAEAEQPPNVLFIVVDDLNDWVGHLGGHPDVKTPHIDRLAKLGVSFTNAHSPAVSCNPSRVAVLSGLRPSTTGIYSNKHARLESLEEVRTLPQHFKAHGYRVLGAGKISHSRPGVQQSLFDEFFPRPPALLRPENPYNGKGNLDWHALDSDDADMPDHKLVDWALEKLAESRSEPLFLAVGIVKPHLPWYVPDEYFALYPKGRVTLPPIRKDDLGDVPRLGMRLAGAENEHEWIERSGKWAEATRGYLAAVSFVDRQIGRLIDGLEQGGKAQNTVVVLWSDHGMHLGEKHHWKKSSLWEESTRTPLIFVAPGAAKAGGRTAQPVDTLSIYPTLADLCGLPIPAHVEGASLRRLLKEPQAPRDGVALTTLRRGSHAVRSERWRYIRYADGSEELYDHDNDPTEWHNLADVPRLTEVKRRLAGWMPKVEAPEAVVSSRPRSRNLILGAGRTEPALLKTGERVRFVVEEPLSASRVELEIREVTDPLLPRFWNGWVWQPVRTRVWADIHGLRWEYGFYPILEPGAHRKFSVQAYVREVEGEADRPAGAREFSIDSGEPEVVIDTPSAAVFGEEIWISGTARDGSCVAAVELAISNDNEERTHYWNGERWQASLARVRARIARPGSNTTRWRYRFAAPVEAERDLGVRAIATDCAGNNGSVAKGLRSSLPGRESGFEQRVTDDGYVVDAEEPTVAITTPENAIFDREIVLVGEARDDLCVAEVELLISETGGQEPVFWDGNRWRDSHVVVRADLARRGSDSTGWRYVFEPPVRPERRLLVKAEARDCARNRSSDKRFLWSHAPDEGTDVAAAGGVLVDTEGPELEIATPSAAVFGEAIHIVGDVRDDFCVGEVSLAISAAENTLFWDGDRWQETLVRLPADLDRRGARTTGWRYSFTPPFEEERRFGVRVYARDCARNASRESTRLWSYAALDPVGPAGFAVDAEEPSVAITTPSSAVFGRRIRFDGQVRDDVCVQEVKLLISTGKGSGKLFWDGQRWRSSASLLKAVLGARGATSMSWSYAFEPPRRDEREFSLKALARDCARKAGTAKQRFLSFAPAGDQLSGAVDGVLVDTEAPTIAITKPLSAELGSTIQIEGEARDNACVTSVELSISQDQTGSHRFWNGERWQPERATVRAELVSRGASSTRWRYLFAPPAEDQRVFRVGARVLDCAGNDGKDGGPIDLRERTRRGGNRGKTTTPPGP